MNTEELQKLIGQKRTFRGEKYTAIIVIIQIVVDEKSVQHDRKEVKTLDERGNYGTFTLDSWLEFDKVD